MSSSRALHSRQSRRYPCCSAFALEERRPCFQFALRARSKPSGVLGPVLAPPCIRQRPFRMAGPSQGVPRRVLAPHLGALLGLPGRFPFFSQAPRGVWGSRSNFCIAPSSLSPLRLLVLGERPNNSLSAFVDVDILDNHLLRPFAPVPV